jgi:septal ring factor EnvC (AmiA/AmiB activator)
MDTPMTPPPFPEDDDTLPGGAPPKNLCKASHLEILAFAEVAQHLRGIREGYAVTNALIEGTNTQLRELLVEMRGINKRVDVLESRLQAQESKVQEHDRLIEDLRRRVG